jgi:hypothetical protein
MIRFIAAYKNVEVVKLQADISNMYNLVCGGVAFCVHAVVIYGNQYDQAAEYAVRQHTGAICAMWSPPLLPSYESESHKPVSFSVPTSTIVISPSQAAFGLPSVPFFDPTVDESPLTSTFSESTGRKMRTPLRRGDIPRQMAHNDSRWRDSGSWPLRANVCTRRVTALLDQTLYNSRERLRYESDAKTGEETYVSEIAVEFPRADGRPVWKTQVVGGVLRASTLTLSHEALLEKKPDISVLYRHILEPIAEAITTMIQLRGILPRPIETSPLYYIVLEYHSLLPLFTYPRASSKPSTLEGDLEPAEKKEAPVHLRGVISPFTVRHSTKTCLVCGVIQETVDGCQGHLGASGAGNHTHKCDACFRIKRSRTIAWGPSQTHVSHVPPSTLPVECHGWCARFQTYDCEVRSCMSSCAVTELISRYMLFGTSDDPDHANFGLALH